MMTSPPDGGMSGPEPIETERADPPPFMPEDLEALYAYQARDDAARWLE